MQVQCPNCKKVRWETTETYSPELTPNGSMLRLLNPWLRNSWPIFGDGVMPRSDGTGTTGTPCAEMDCMECLAALAPSGKLTVIGEVSPMEVGIPGVETEEEEKIEPEVVSEPEAISEPEVVSEPEPEERDPLLIYKCSYCDEWFKTKHRKFKHEVAAHD